jgi:hypothetical protein
MDGYDSTAIQDTDEDITWSNSWSSEKDQRRLVKDNEGYYDELNKRARRRRHGKGKGDTPNNGADDVQDLVIWSP